MHVAVDQTGKHQPAAMVDCFGRRRWHAFTDRGDSFATHGDIAIRQNGVGRHDGADNHPIERC